MYREAAFHSLGKDTGKRHDQPRSLRLHCEHQWNTTSLWDKQNHYTEMPTQRDVYEHITFLKNKWTQKIWCASIKKIGIIITGLSLSFFSILLIHGLLSLHLKFFHIRICRHFSSPAIVYNAWHSEPQMETWAQPRGTDNQIAMQEKSFVPMVG